MLCPFYPLSHFIFNPMLQGNYDPCLQMRKMRFFLEVKQFIEIRDPDLLVWVRAKVQKELEEKLMQINC